MRQQGVVMVIALIMLAVVTLIGTVSANLVMGNLRVVQNSEARAVTKSNAISAVQEAIVTSGFFEGQKAFAVACKSDGYTRCFDMSGDNVADDLSVSLTRPRCLSARPLLKADVGTEGWVDEVAASCIRFSDYSTANPINMEKNSHCADVLWTADVTAEDGVTGARVLIKQGFAQRISTDDLRTTCQLGTEAG